MTARVEIVIWSVCGNGGMLLSMCWLLRIDIRELSEKQKGNFFGHCINSENVNAI